MEQGVIRRSALKDAAAIGRRPEAWLIALLVWTLGSAARSLGTPWAQAAGTEALRWGAGIVLALALGWFWRRTELAGQFVVTVTGAMAAFGVLGGETAANSGLAGPYHDHQLYGSALVLLLPFSAVFALSSPSAPWRWGSLAALTAGTLCLLLSQTRSAWAGLATAAFVFGWLWLSRPASRPERLRVAFIPLAVLLLGLGLAWLLAGPAPQQAAMTHRAATLTALSEDVSWRTRLDLWRGTARMVTAHPAFGIGLGRYPGSVWLWTRSAGLLTPLARPSLSNEAHSFYGQTSAEMGVAGLGLYCAALAAFAFSGTRRLWKSRRRLSPQNALLIAALSALAGQSVDALASPSWQFPEVSFFFWGVLGLGLASLRRAQAPAATLLPYPLRRAGQFALSGGLAVALTAQVLPIGLLTPVEAYDHVAAITYKSVSLSQAPCTSGSGHCFSLIAVYSDGNHDVTLDNGGLAGASAQSYFTCVDPPSSTCLSKFGTGSARNNLSVSQSEVGKSLNIAGVFYDGTYPSMPFVAGKGTYKAYQGTLTFTPTASP